MLLGGKNFKTKITLDSVKISTGNKSVNPPELIHWLLVGVEGVAHKLKLDWEV